MADFGTKMHEQVESYLEDLCITWHLQNLCSLWELIEKKTLLEIIKCGYHIL